MKHLRTSGRCAGLCALLFILFFSAGQASAQYEGIALPADTKSIGIVLKTTSTPNVIKVSGRDVAPSMVVEFADLLHASPELALRGNGACVAIFLGEMSARAETLCLGNTEQCMFSNDPLLRWCGLKMARRPDAVSDVHTQTARVEGGDDIYIRYIAEEGMLNVTVNYLSEDAGAAPCPEFRYTQPSGPTAISVVRTLAKGTVFPESVYHIDGTPVLRSGDSSVSIEGLVFSKYEQLTLGVVTPRSGTTGACYWETLVLPDSTAFRVSFDILMPGPTKAITVANVRTTPDIAQFTESVVRVQITNSEAEVASVYMDASRSAVSLPIEGCTDLYNVRVAIYGLQGVLLALGERAFSPSDICAQSGLPLSCFCEAGSTAPLDARFGTAPVLSAETSAHVVPAFIASGHPLGSVTSRIVADASDFAGAHSCAAFHIRQRRTIYGKPTSLVTLDGKVASECRVDVPPGLATVYHGLVTQRESASGLVGPRGVVYRNIKIQRNGFPVVRPLRTSPENPELIGLYVDHTSVWAQDDETHASFPRSSRWDTVFTHATHEIFWSTNLTLATSSANVLFYPGPGRYGAQVSWFDTGHEQQPRYTTHSLEIRANHTEPRPILCPSGTATATATNAPVLPTDTDGFVAVTVARADSTSAERVWSVRVAEDEVYGGWYEYARTTGLGDPPAYVHTMRAGVVYTFEIMVLTVLPGSTNLFADNLCFMQAGRVDPLPPLRIWVQPDIEMLACEQNALLFTVMSSMPLGPPSAGYPVDVLSETSDGKWTAYEMVIGPNVNPYEDLHKFNLVFDMGKHGPVEFSGLSEIVDAHPAIPWRSFSIARESLVLSHMDEHTQFEEGHAPHCGPSLHAVDLTVNSQSRLPYAVRVGSVVNEIGEGGTKSLRFQNLMAPPINNPEPLEVVAALMHGDSFVLSMACPADTLFLTISPYIPITATAHLKAIDGPKDVDAESFCAGKRQYRFHRPNEDELSLRFSTLDDPDLGTRAIAFDELYDIAPRAEPMRLYVTYSAEGGGWQASHCIALVDIPEAFAATPPDMTVIAKRMPACSESAQAQVAQVILGTQPGNTITLRRDGAVFYYVGYPTTPADGYFTYRDLPIGVYDAEIVSLPEYDGAESAYPCAVHRTVTVGNVYEPDEIFVLGERSSGTRQLLCPWSINSESGGAAQGDSHDFELAETFALMHPMDTLRYRVWNSATQTVADGHLYEEAGKTKGYYMLPEPGTYTGELTVSTAGGGTCTYFMPDYTVVDAMYTPASFIIEVDRYPTCLHSDDGAVYIRYPENVPVEHKIVECVGWDVDAAPCQIPESMRLSREPKTGGLVVPDVPFLRTLTIQFDVMGSCRFSKTFAFPPPMFLYPHISEIVYEPSCDRMHDLYAVHTDQNNHTHHGAATATTVYAWTVRPLGARHSAAHEYNSHAIVVDSLTTTGYSVDVEVRYNDGRCVSTAHLDLRPEDMFHPPTVAFKPMKMNSAAQSLPVFCPGASDGQLVAELDPPQEPGTTVVWAKNAVNMNVGNISFPRPDLTMAHSLGSGTYVVMYALTSERWGLSCVAEDQITIHPKTRYNSEALIRVHNAPCNGGLGSAEILPVNNRDLLEPEFALFRSSMVADQESRAYIGDTGSGSSKITGVPNGHTMRLLIAYPDTYVHRPAPFCAVPLDITFARAAPIPSIVVSPILVAPVSYVAVRIPSWVENAELAWNLDEAALVPASHARTTIATIDTTQPGSYAVNVHTTDEQACMQESVLTVGAKWAAAPTFRATPASQTLVCPEDVPESVLIEAVSALGDVGEPVGVVPPTDLFKFFDEVWDDGTERYVYTPSLQNFAPDSVAFSIKRAAPLVVEALDVVDPTCSGRDTMTLAVSFYDGGLERVDVAYMADHGEECLVVDGKLHCTVPRTRPVVLDLPFWDGAGETMCSMSISTDEQVALAKASLPDLVISHVGENCRSGFVVSSPEYPDFETDELWPGIHRIIIREDDCPVDVAIPLPSQKFHMEGGLMSELTVTQVIPPTCAGLDDGMLVLTDPSARGAAVLNVAYIEDADLVFSEVDISGEPPRWLISGLKHGTYAFVVDGDPERCPIVVTVDMPVQPPPIIVVQPASQPAPPERGVTTSRVTGVPEAVEDDFMLHIYKSAGYAKTEIVVVTDQKTQTVVTDIVPGSIVGTWDAPRSFSISGPHAYSVFARCPQRAEQIAPPEPLSDILTFETRHAPPMQLDCHISRLPSSPIAHDGIISITITGGVGPFYGIFPGGSASETQTRVMLFSAARAGPNRIVVQDAGGGSVDAGSTRETRYAVAPKICTVNVFYNGRFQVASIDPAPVPTTGCWSDTRAAYDVVVWGDTDSVLVGYWFDNPSVPPIASCEDPRMGPPELVHSYNTVRVILPEGRWYVAVCNRDSISTTEHLGPVFVDMNTPDMTIDYVQDGEVCSTIYNPAPPVNKAPLVFSLQSSVPNFVEYVQSQDFGRASLTVVSPSEVRVSVPVLTPGVFRYEFRTPSGCTKTVLGRVRNTGVLPCGTCDVNNHSCYGCDGVPNSGAVVDLCGVCKGANRCLSTCTMALPEFPNVDRTEQLTEMAGWCADRGRELSVTFWADIARLNLPEVRLALVGVPHSSDTYLNLRTLNLTADAVSMRRFHFTVPVRITTNHLVISESLLGADLTVVPLSCSKQLVVSIEDSAIGNTSVTISPTCAGYVPPPKPMMVAQAQVAELARSDRMRRIQEPVAEALVFEDVTIEEDFEGSHSVTLKNVDAGDVVLLGAPIDLELNDTTIRAIRLVNGSGYVAFLVTDTDVDCVEIEDFLLENSTIAETRCAIFIQIPSARKIIYDGNTYFRSTTDCSAFGGSEPKQMGAGLDIFFICIAILVVGVGFMIFVATKSKTTTK